MRFYFGNDPTDFLSLNVRVLAKRDRQDFSRRGVIDIYIRNLHTRCEQRSIAEFVGTLNLNLRCQAKNICSLFEYEPLIMACAITLSPTKAYFSMQICEAAIKIENYYKCVG